MFDSIRLAASPSSKTLVIAQFKDAKPDAASLKSLGSAAASVAEAGIVSIQETTMCFPTDHCTIFALSPAPTPMTLEATT